MDKLNQLQIQQYFRRYYFTILNKPILDFDYHNVNSFEQQATINKIETISIQGWRPTNEDNISVTQLNNNILAVVFDGHGGDWVANYCQEFYSDIFFNTVEYQRGNYHEAFKKANKLMDLKLFNEEPSVMFEYAKSKLTKQLFKYRYAFKNSSYNHSNQCGCTCCAVLITDNEIICSNIGDSKAIAFSDKHLSTLNEEHKLTNEKELYRLKQNGFEIINERLGGSLNVIRGFGDFEFKSMSYLDDENLQGVLNVPEVLSFPKSLYKHIIIGCDGLWDCYNEEECRKKILNNTNLKELAKSCIQDEHILITNEPKGYDNVSIISIFL